MFTPDKLATLPIRDGFRLRGLDMTRIETFTDAAFAFALTLLIIAGEPPANMQELGLALRDVPAFVCSASLLMVFWYGHHQWSRRYGLDDLKTVALSAALVFSVLVYIYPLRFVARGLFQFIAWVTGLPVSSTMVMPRAEFVTPERAAAEINGFFIAYGIGFVVISMILALLHAHAYGRREELALNLYETRATLGDVGAWSILAGVGLLSVIVAATTTAPGAPGYVYMLLAVVMPLYGKRLKRNLQSIEASERTPAAAPDPVATT